MTGTVVEVVPAHRRAAVGALLQAVAVAGVLVAVLVAVIGVRVATQLDRVVEGSTTLSADVLEQLADTLDLAGGLVDELDTTLTELEGALVATGDSFVVGGDALVSVAALAEDAAPALGSTTDTLRRLEGVATTIDRTLSALSALPFGPDYDPEDSFATTVGQLADDLEPLPASFAATASDLEDVAASTIELERELRSLTVAVGDAAERVRASAALVDEYRATAERARVLASELGAGVGVDLAVLQVVVLLGALVLAAAQLVAWLVGAALREAADGTVPATAPADG